MKKSLILLLSFLLSGNLNAQDHMQVFSEVVSVNNKEKTLMITHDNSNPWTLDDRVCVIQEDKDIACGIVVSVDSELATVKLLSQTEEIAQATAQDSSGEYIQLTFDYPNPKKGDSVRLVDKNPASAIRQLSSELKKGNEFGGEKISSNIYDHLAVTPAFVPESILLGGINFIFPTVEYQQTTTEHSSVGVSPIFMNYPVSDGTIKGTGCFVNFHHYSQGHFSGYWLKTGLGLYGLSYKYKGKEDDNVVPAITASFGKRIFKNEHLNFGFAAGGQYLFASTKVGMSFSRFIPSLILDIGFAF
jgi:hypothetical protein